MKKKRKNSKSIGDTNERNVAKLFDKWWLRGKFVRTKNLQVVGHADRIAHGDITPILEHKPAVIDTKFPWSIECKKCEEWSWMEFLKGNLSIPHYEWWQQCKRDAELFHRHPLLVFTKNHKPQYAMVLSTSNPDVTPRLSALPEPWFMTNFDGDYVFIMTLEAFFKGYPVNGNLN